MTEEDKQRQAEDLQRQADELGMDVSRLIRLKEAQNKEPPALGCACADINSHKTMRRTASWL